ncbi:MAG: NADH-quinone oxidoreductase subunit K [Anaerolineae bacterium]|mgnify:CR=1 FL=1|jgi:NADH-quinone oxidoreductase subunit K|nr:NADH-quinone oxidoreductase subunit K [Anaerolineae bacterium]
MHLETLPWLDFVNTSLSIFLFGLGLFCLLTRRDIIKQVIGLKIMLQGVTLSLLNAGILHQELRVAQAMVVSALVVETVVIAVALALIINVFRHYPSGDVDQLNKLLG